MVVAQPYGFGNFKSILDFLETLFLDQLHDFRYYP